jgi:hypothetical protein
VAGFWDGLRRSPRASEGQVAPFGAGSRVSKLCFLGLIPMGTHLAFRKVKAVKGYSVSNVRTYARAMCIAAFLPSRLHLF